MQSRRRPGFTLIELLVATAITAVLATVLLGISQNFLESYRRTVSGNAVERDARFALDLLSEDLGALVVPRRIANAEAINAVVETVNGAETVWLTFLSNANDPDPDNVPGSPRAVSYRVAYLDPISGGGERPAFALYRSVAGMRQTLDDAIGEADLRQDFWEATPNTRPQDYLVGNVVEFRLRVRNPETNEWVDLSSPGNSLRASAAGFSATGADGPAVGKQIPDVLEISISVISREGAERLRDGSLTLDESIKRYGRSFERRIPLTPALN